MTAEEKNQTDLENIERKQKFTGTVSKIMLAGAIVDIGMDVPGIIHISQLQADPVNKIEDVLEVGQKIDVWVKRVFTKKQRIELTMIEPLPLEWREIKEGLVVKGTVERLENYGAFVEIGAERPGLVHISELAHGFIKSPDDAVKVGEEIEVKVLSVNRRRKQIKLSVKALMDSPAEMMKKVQEVQIEDDEPQQPVPTAMELAIRQAMEKSQDSDETEETKQSKKGVQNNEELDGILSRTLEHKVKTE